MVSSSIEVRVATDADLEQVVALQVERNGAMWEATVRALFARAEVGPGCFTVAVEGERVVSSLCVLPTRLRVGGVDIPVGQPEFVATAASHGHGGLVRAQMGVVHGWSAERGDLTQIIAGIPYFYRRFGYEYAIAFPRVRLVLPGVSLSMPDGWSVRRAEVGDVPEIMRLHALAQDSFSLAAIRTDEWWRWSLGVGEPSHVCVAEYDGAVRGTAGLGDGPPGLDDTVTMVRTVAYDRLGALRAFLAEAATTGKPVAVEERGPFTAPVDQISHRHPHHYAMYVRVADPVALLNHLRPVLSARLAASPRGDDTGQLLLSSYSSSLVIHYDRGEVTAVEAGPPEQTPVAQGGAGVPPDLIATLIYGRYGALGLAERHDDVRLGRVADLMETLFPRLDADIALAD